jgi:hypothetical protein
MHLLQVGCGAADDCRGDDSNAMSDGLVLYWKSWPVKTPYGECGSDFIMILGARLFFHACGAEKNMDGLL